MKKIVLVVVISLFTILNSSGQRKKIEALTAQKEALKQTLDSVQANFVICARNLKTSEVRVAALSNQVNDLQQSNATLLNNLESFAKLSNQKESNLEQSLINSKSKDEQLNALNKAIQQNDSLVLALVTTLNGAMQNTQASKVGVSSANGAVYLSFNNAFLFTEDGKGISEAAKLEINKLLPIIRDITVTNLKVESLEEKTADVKIDSYGNSLQKAVLFTSVLVKEFGLTISNVNSYYKADSKGGIPDAVTRLVIIPKFDAFYLKVKKILKEG
jgi:hypothetical protein